MLTLRLLLRAVPWIVVLIFGGLLFFQNFSEPQEPKTTVIRNVVLREVEAIGKLELVRYNFKEITELEKLSREYFFKIIKFGPDSKIALITSGTAAGCIDLTKIESGDIQTGPDTIYIRLPEAELCYYKLDMEKTHIYSLEVNPMINEKAFIQQAYQLAEQEIRDSALESGILEQATANAELILRPVLEKITGKSIVFTKRPKNIFPEAVR